MQTPISSFKFDEFEVFISPKKVDWLRGKKVAPFSRVNVEAFLICFKV